MNRTIPVGGLPRGLNFEDFDSDCFMPDHLHLLSCDLMADVSLTRFITRFKQQTAHRFSQQNHERLWQKKYHDHILRADEHWEPVAFYIWMNPVRRGLCSRPEEWAFSGSFQLDWRHLLGVGMEPWAPPWEAGDASIPLRRQGDDFVGASTPAACAPI